MDQMTDTNVPGMGTIRMQAGAILEGAGAQDAGRRRDQGTR